MQYTRLLLIAVLTVVSSLGCGAPEEPPPTHQRVENAALGLAFADLPNDCTLMKNEGPDLELSCGSPTGSSGKVTLELRPPEEGSNVLAAANAQRELFEAMPGGRYYGNRELVTPHGVGYTARGSYDEGDRRVEELRVLTLHPSGFGILVYHLAYPDGDDSRARADQLLYLVGEAEELLATTSDGADSS